MQMYDFQHQGWLGQEGGGAAQGGTPCPTAPIFSNRILNKAPHSRLDSVGFQSVDSKFGPKPEDLTRSGLRA